MGGLNYGVIALISGRSQESMKERFLSALKEFVIDIKDTQEILIEGRVILAISFFCDPAHISAIEKDLSSIAESLNLDLAFDPL